jgi:cellulose synthase/poly-beta-1,6-N-acetylglucosamine synthase-like glycosyltransferase
LSTAIDFVHYLKQKDTEEMPKVDVIIPAYNAANYLSAAIESVIAQTFEDWRIVLVDDGSTDSTAEIAAGFVQRLGQKLKYIHQSNHGLPAARNAAIRNSTAEFLALLDSDDIWLPCRLAESLKFFDSHPKVGLTYSSVAFVDEAGEVLQTFDTPQKYAEGNIAPYIYMRSVQLPCPTITFLRKCVEEVGLFDETMRATEDRDLWFRIALKFEVGFIHKVLAHYRTSPTSMSTDQDRMLRAQLQFIQKHYGAPGCGAVARRIALSQCYKQHAEALQKRGQQLAAIRSSVQSLSYYPFDSNNVRSAASLLLKAAGIRR